MRTPFKLLLTLAIFASMLVATPIQAAVKSGAKCPKLGAIANKGDYQYKCVKKNMKLVWGAKTLVKKAEASPAPTQSSNKKVLPEYWPLDQVANQDLVAIADASVRKHIAGTSILPKLNLMTGPTTNKVNAQQYLKYLEKSAIGWGKDWMPEQVDIAMANVNDYEWISQLWPKYGLVGGFDSSKANWERNGNQCNQGSAIYNPGSNPFFWGCLPNTFADVIGLNKFGPHEYTHLAQNAIIYYQSGRKVWNLPWLFAEGSADFYGVTYATTLEKASSDWNSYWINGYISSEARADLKRASVAEIEDLLMDAMLYGKKAQSHWYWTGAYATLRLVAAKGHEGFLQYMREYGQSGNAFTSFEKVYGMTFEKFAKIIAPEIKTLTPQLRN